MSFGMPSSGDFRQMGQLVTVSEFGPSTSLTPSDSKSQAGNQTHRMTPAHFRCRHTRRKSCPEYSLAAAR